VATPFSLKKSLCFVGFMGALYIPNLQAQTMTDLGTLGGTNSSAYAVSADGSVIVGERSLTGDNASHAFKYSGSTMTDLGTLGGTLSAANAVSADGSVIVGESYLTGDSAYHAFKYTGSTMTDLGTLGGTHSSPSAISADGNVIVGWSNLAGGSARHAFKYTGSTMTDLGTLGGTNSFASAVSADGSVIVGESYLNGDSAHHAFKYSGSTMTDLGTLGGTNSSASAVSADGNVIVGWSNLAGGSATHAFKYTGSTMTDLGTLGGTYSSASAVSADGKVIVGWSNLTGDNAQHAFKYSGSTMTDLGTLGGTYSFATAVSADGSVIVGEGHLTGDSTFHAFKYSGSTMTDLGTLGGTLSTATAVSADGKVIVGLSQTTGDIATHAFIYNNEAAGPLVDVQNTYTALSSNSYQLNSILNAQNTLLSVSLNYDCTVYSANDVCVGVGGRYTNVSNPTSTQTAGNIQLGYRPHPSFRIGAFLDQGISYTTPSNYTVNNSQPLVGLFAVYAPTGTALGPQVKVSGAYGSNGATIARTTLANTEAGRGNSTLTTQGAQLEVAYGITANENWIVSPFAGIKATSVSRNGYTETAGASFPITYNAVSQSATTVFAGAKVMGYVIPKVSVGVNAGVEQDLNSSVSNNSGSIYFLGSYSLAAPSIQKTRAFVGANTAYWLDKNERVSLGVYYNQQSLNTSNGITAMLNYTIGL
jgi:probable HAF family extracellular repeat protein